MKINKLSIWFLAFLYFSSVDIFAAETEALSIMKKAYENQLREPFIYQELSMHLIDNHGKANTRNLRLYSALNEIKKKILLTFDSPEEIRGFAVRAEFNQSLNHSRYDLYLPSLKNTLISTKISGRSSDIVGTDISLLDLLPENPVLYNYKILEMKKIQDIDYYIIEAKPINKKNFPETYSKRNLMIRKDNYLITQIEYFDSYDRHIRTKTSHALKEATPGIWQPAMQLIKNHRKNHKTIIKIENQVFSPDYVNKTIFTDKWITANKHIMPTEQIIYLLGTSQL